jgi:hypothetical protein
MMSFSRNDAIKFCIVECVCKWFYCFSFVKRPLIMVLFVCLYKCMRVDINNIWFPKGVKNSYVHTIYKISPISNSYK